MSYSGNSVEPLTPSRRIAALDGWRGIAILLVLIDHFQYALLGRYARPWTQTGQHGVTVFFVLSGFLITNKLLEGPIDLPRFYVRRFFRLMPVAWAYIGTNIMLRIILHFPVKVTSGMVAALLFVRNITGTGGGMGHFWSLSMEEQFYFVWPCLLFVFGRRRAFWTACAGAIACATFRYFNWAHYDRHIADYLPQVRADALLLGCILALTLSKAKGRMLLERWSARLKLPAAAVLCFCVLAFHWLPPFMECVSIALLVGMTVLHPRSASARALAFPPLVWLGIISYSVYVWQEMFMGSSNPAALFILMPLVVMLSYHWLEKPFIRLGYRLTAKRTQRPAAEASSCAG